MIATNVSTNKYKSNSERELHRYEFVEFIVRLGLTKYKEPKKVETLMQSTEMILQEDVLPNNTAVDGKKWREEHLYNLKVDEIFRRNQPVIEKLFLFHTTPNKKFITLEECATLIKVAGFEILDTRICPCYVESMMSRIDTLSDLSSLQQMKYVEFIVFIARVAHEIYLNHPKFSSLGLHLKIDKILGPILGIPPLYLTKLHSFKEEQDDDESGDDDDKESSASAELTELIEERLNQKEAKELQEGAEKEAVQGAGDE